MSATIRDVARKAGVGLGTVSRVLNDSPLVSSATRQRVLNVIAELNYMPSHAARSLSLGKTLTVATIAPFFTRPSVVERLCGIEANLTGSGYHQIFFNVENVERRNECLRDVSRREYADGVLIISLTPHADEIAPILKSHMPVVLIDAEASGLTDVRVDNPYGGYLATQHLIDLGHQNIAYLSDPLQDPLYFDFTSSRDRYQGYCKALNDADIPIRPDNHVWGLHGRYEARCLARNLLSRYDRPTAIFAASDTQAMGVLEAARDLSVRVPDELSVIGFDDIDVAEYLGLTTIRQPLFESGARGVELLLEILGSEESYLPPKHEMLPIELVVRSTTAPCQE